MGGDGDRTGEVWYCYVCRVPPYPEIPAYLGPKGTCVPVITSEASKYPSPLIKTAWVLTYPVLGRDMRNTANHQ